VCIFIDRHSPRNSNPQYYAGMSFKISIHFPPNYPYVPPVIKYESPCFHPNVDIASGAICLDILQVRIPGPWDDPKLTLS
jgi:ubiquitin-protein ligase